MKRSHREKGLRQPSLTWEDLTRHLALHINWLHRTTAKTSASNSKIERWRQVLETASSRPEQTGDLH